MHHSSEHVTLSALDEHNMDAHKDSACHQLAHAVLLQVLPCCLETFLSSPWYPMGNTGLCGVSMCRAEGAHTCCAGSVSAGSAMLVSSARLTVCWKSASAYAPQSLTAIPELGCACWLRSRLPRRASCMSGFPGAGASSSSSPVASCRHFWSKSFFACQRKQHYEVPSFISVHSRSYLVAHSYRGICSLLLRYYP
jgi:hypothetical protein